jgi:hypothetical protein
MSGNHIGKSALIITGDAAVFNLSKPIGLGIMLYRANFGEDKLTRMGIEAGKSYIKK